MHNNNDNSIGVVEMMMIIVAAARANFGRFFTLESFELFVIVVLFNLALFRKLKRILLSTRHKKLMALKYICSNAFLTSNFFSLSSCSRIRMERGNDDVRNEAG